MREIIVAMRGRYKGVGGSVVQKLEPQFSGLCNTITSVQKDNMVLEETEKTTHKRLIPISCAWMVGAKPIDIGMCQIASYYKRKMSNNNPESMVLEIEDDCRSDD